MDILLDIYFLGAAITAVIVFAETYYKYRYHPDPYLATLCGISLGAAWPIIAIPFLFELASGHYAPNSALMCRLTGGHDWHTIGGITFEGVKGVFPNGHQQLHCFRCRAQKWYWPWGDRVFSEDETFGYRKREPGERRRFIW